MARRFTPLDTVKLSVWCMRVNFRLWEAPNMGRRRLVHARDVVYGKIDKGKDGWITMLRNK